MRIEHITCDSGDWEVLLLDGDVWYDGHSIPTFTWLELLKAVEGFELQIIERVISDKEMEEGLYGGQN